MYISKRKLGAVRCYVDTLIRMATSHWRNDDVEAYCRVCDTLDGVVAGLDCLGITLRLYHCDIGDTVYTYTLEVI